MVLKVLLINPPDTAQCDVSNPPLGLLYLAGYIKDICEVKVLDGFLVGWDGVENEIKKGYDIVGVTALTPGRKQALRILSIAKDRGSFTIMGGAHPSLMWKQILNHYPYVDVCVIGEGEATLRELVLNIENYRNIKGLAYFTSSGAIYTGNRGLLDLKTLPWPDWEQIDFSTDRYIGNVDLRVPIIFSRGCVSHCIFCSTTDVWRTYRVRDVLDTVNEIEHIVKTYGKTHFVFEDDAFSLILPRAKDLMTEIAERNLGIRFFATTRADAVDMELLTLMKQAGCYGVSYGFESGSQEILQRLNKNCSVEQNIEAVRMSKEAGLSVCALIIQNPVGETPETRKQTEDFLNLTKPDDVGTVGGLWILPGTKLYLDMVKAGHIVDDYWLSDEPYYVYRGERI